VLALAGESREVYQGGRPEKAVGWPFQEEGPSQGSFGRHKGSDGIQKRVLTGNLRKFYLALYKLLL
jgi:hypothetical protein